MKLIKLIAFGAAVALGAGACAKTEDDKPGTTTGGTTADATTGGTTDAGTGSTGDATTGGKTDATTGGTADATTGGTSDATTGGTGDATAGDATTGGTTDAGTTGQTLYDQLGGKAAIEKVIGDFVNIVIADARINQYFLNKAVDNTRLVKCLVKLASAATGGPDKYPGLNGPPEKDADGCRNMAESHKGMGVSAKDFGDLVEDFAKALKDNKVPDDIIAKLGGALGGLSGAIVEDKDNNKTAYQRLGRFPAVQAAVGELAKAIGGAQSIVGFFAASDFNRLGYCLQRQVCSIDGPCDYGQEVDSVTAGFKPAGACRTMLATHADMKNPGNNNANVTLADFNAVVEALAGVLTKLAVPDADKNAILGALAPTCPDIVYMGKCPASADLCKSYCATVTDNCKDANAQYKDLAECESNCKDWQKLDAGQAGAKDGNSVQCRVYHAGAAKDTGKPEVHCEHSGKTGGNVCGSWCDNYCHLAMTACTGTNKLFDTNEACMTECAKYPATGKSGDTGGNTVQCRIYHAGVASQSSDNATKHCSHAGISGDKVCVD